jgi:YD repeat-containing protein
MDRFPDFASCKRYRPRISAALFLAVAFLLVWILLPGSASAQLYVAQYGFGTVSEYDLTSGAAINVNLIDTGLSTPAGLALSGNTLFVANSGVNMVGKYTVNATMVTEASPTFISTGLSTPIGVAVSGSHLFVVNANGNQAISEYDATKGMLQSASFLPPSTTQVGGPIAIAVSSNFLFVAHYQEFTNLANNFGLGSVGQYDLNSGAVVNERLIKGLAGPIALAVSGDTLFVVNSGYTAAAGGSVGTYDATSGDPIKPSFITGVRSPYGLAVATSSGPEPAISGKNNGGEKCQTCPCHPGEPVLALVGDPINAGTGNLFETQTDFTAAPETQLSFTRYYNSFDTSSAGLGVGWRSTYHRGLSATATTITVTRADGRQDIYTKSGSSYVPDPDVTNVLTPVPATGTQTGWKLKLADDSTESYTLAGLLTSITTRAGLTTTLTYNTANQLTAVTGPFGHKLTFTYDTSDRMSTMTVPDGGRFTYDSKKGGRVYTKDRRNLYSAQRLNDWKYSPR